MGSQQDNQSVSVKDWVLTILITAIPVVGLVMLFVWAFSDDTIPAKANWAKARLVWLAIGIVFSVVFIALFGATLLALLGDLPNTNF